MKKQTCRKVLSLLLVICMLTGMFSVTAFAENTDETNSETSTITLERAVEGEEVVVYNPGDGFWDVGTVEYTVKCDGSPVIDFEVEYDTNYTVGSLEITNDGKLSITFDESGRLPFIIKVGTVSAEFALDPGPTDEQGGDSGGEGDGSDNEENTAAYLAYRWIGETELYRDINGYLHNTSPVEIIFVDENGEQTVVPPSSLTSSDSKVISVSAYEMATDATEIGYHSVGEAVISYVKDNETYSFAVKCTLPDVGFYSSMTVSEETYLAEFAIKDDANVFYLIPANGVTINSVEWNELGTVADCVLEDDGSYATITVNGKYDAGRFYNIHAELVGNDPDWSWGSDCGIMLKNGNPYLALRFLDEENGNFAVNSSHTPETSLNVSVDGGATVVFYLVTESAETVVPAAMLTTSDEKILTVSQAEEHQDATHISPVSIGQATLEYVVGEKTYEFPVSITEPSGGEGGGPGEGDVILDDNTQGLKYRQANIVPGESGNSHVENTNAPRQNAIIGTAGNAFPVTFYYVDANGVEARIDPKTVTCDNANVVELTVYENEPTIAHVQLKTVGTTNLSYKVCETVYTIPVTVTEFVDQSDPNSGNFGTPGGTWSYRRNEEGGNKLTISHVENNTDIDGVLPSNAINGITTIEFTSGITGVTASFFSNCGNVTTFIFPDTVTRVVVPSGFDLNACTFEGFSEDEVQVEASGGPGGPGAGGISLGMPDGGTAGSGSSFQLGADSTVTLTVYLDGQAITDYDFSIDTINLVTVEKNAEGKLVVKYLADGITNIKITASNGTTASYVCNTGSMGGGPGGPGMEDVTLDDGSQGLKYRFANVDNGVHTENIDAPRRKAIAQNVGNAFPVTFYYVDENGNENKINAKAVSSDNTEIVQITVNDSESDIAHVQMKAIGGTNLSYKVGETVYTIPVTVTEFVDMSDPNSGDFNTPGGTWHYERNEEGGNKLTISHVTGNTSIDGILPTNAINGIEIVKFDNSITGVTASFFSNCGNVTTFIFPSTVTSVIVPSSFDLDGCTFEGFDEKMVVVEGNGGPGGPGLQQGLMLNAPQNATLAYNFIPDGGEITIPVGFEFYISAFMDGAPITQYMGYTVEIVDKSLLSAENKIGGGVYFTGLKAGDTEIVATDRKTGTTATFTVHMISEPAASGSFIGLAGEILWERDNGVLTIKPNGPVTSVSSIPGAQFQDIKEVVFAEGITEVRYGVFREINHVTKFTFPSTIRLVQMENGTILTPYTFNGFDKANVVFVNPDGTEGPPPVQVVDNDFFMLCDGYSIGDGEYFAGVVNYEMPILMYREETFRSIYSVTSSDETVVQVIETDSGWSIKPLKEGEAAVTVRDTEGNTVTATCVIDGKVKQIGPASDIIDGLPEEMYKDATVITLEPSATPVNVIDSIYHTQHEYFDVIKMKLIVPEDGVYKLSVDMDKYANTVIYTRTAMSSIPFYNRITGGYNGTSSHMKTWEWYNLKQGEYDVVAVVSQRGVYFKNGVKVTFEKTAYPMAFQNAQLGFDGIVSGRVEGFYNPEDKTDDVVTTNGNVSINVSVEQGDHVIGASVSVAAATANTLVEHEVASATLGTNVADVTFDQDALKKLFNCIKDAGGMDAQFSVNINGDEKTKVVNLNLNVMQSEVLPEATENQNGNVTVTVPFVKLGPGESVIVNYLTPNGPIPMEATYDAKTQTVTFRTKHFSSYQIVHVEACLDGHTLTDVAEKNATCTTDGCYAHQYCEVCQKKFMGGYEVSDEALKIPANHNKVSKVDAKAPTCTVAGNNEYYICSSCGNAFKDAEAKKTTTSGAELLPAKGHSLTKNVGKEATYTTEGMKEHWSCGTCGLLFSDAAGKNKVSASDLVIPKLIKVEEGNATVTEEAVTEAVKNAADSDTVELPLTNASEEITSAEIPVASLETVAETEKTLVIETKQATVKLDADAVHTIVKEAGEVENIKLVIDIVEEKRLNEKQQTAVKEHDVAAVVSAEIICNGKNVHDFKGGVVTVEIAFKPAEGTRGSDYMLIYIADDGSKEEVKSYYKDGRMVADLKHFSEYVIVKKNVPEMTFTDVTEGKWYYDAVGYVYKNGLMNGVGSSEFNPTGTMTRAMMVTVLHRIEGEPEASANPFTDLTQDWYKEAVAWAAENGIVKGTGVAGIFDPDGKVTREQLAVFMYRYAKYKGIDVSAQSDLKDFPDADEVSSWAEIETKWAVAAGLINGKGTAAGVELAPKDSADRAACATILMRFVQNVLEK